jgi:hypothetical protein
MSRQELILLLYERDRRHRLDLDKARRQWHRAETWRYRYFHRKETT